MHVQAALRAVEGEILELAFEIRLHLEELEPQHLRVDGDRMIASTSSLRLVNELVGLDGLLGDGADRAFENLALLRHAEVLVGPCDPVVPTGTAPPIPHTRWLTMGEGRGRLDLRGWQEGGALVMRSSGEGAKPEAEGRRLGGGAIASLIGVGLLLIFMIQNTESVQLDFLVWSFTWPLWLLTMASAVLGALVWFGLGVMRRHRRRKERRQDRRG